MKKETTKDVFTVMNPEGRICTTITSESKYDCMLKTVLMYTSIYEGGGVKSYWTDFLYPRGWRICKATINIQDIIIEEKTFE